MIKERGLVLWARLDRGFGFVRTPIGQSVFFHMKNVTDGFLLEEGDTVEYTVSPSSKRPGKMECLNVTLAARANKTAVKP